MLLIITCSADTTTDMLMPLLKGINVFRFNIDKWDEYRWDFSSKGFNVESSDGNTLTNDNIRCVYLRKAVFIDPIDVPKEGCLENWMRGEIERLWKDLYYDMAAKNKAILVKPAKSRWDKYTQMTLAQKYFNVPEWHIIRGKIPEETKNGEWITKSLTQEQIGKGKTFITKKVDTRKINLYYQWLLQRRIKADYDVTSLYVKGKIFSFQLDRSRLTHDDCRVETPFLNWDKCELSREEEKSIEAFMNDTGFEFGRFDFLRKGNDLYFLELNPNGIWAWLDLEYKNGIFECVTNEIKTAYYKRA